MFVILNGGKMYKTRTLTIGKSRLLRRGNLQTWVKAEVMGEFDSDPTLEDVIDMITDIDTILNEEEATENVRWNSLKDQPRKQ